MQEFLDLSNLTKKDWEDIEHMAKALSIDFNQALYKYMHENPGKIRCLGQIKNGEVTSDEITIDGVKEHKGNNALMHMFDQVLKNKEEKE